MWEVVAQIRGWAEYEPGTLVELCMTIFVEGFHCSFSVLHARRP